MRRFTSYFAKSLVALLLVGGPFATYMQAQNDAVTVSVPFRFTMGTHSIAPGMYQFALVSSQFLLSVTNVKTGRVEMFDVRPERQSSVEERGRLTFRNAAGRNVLDQVHFPDTDTFSEVIEPSHAGRTESARVGAGTPVNGAQH